MIIKFIKMITEAFIDKMVRNLEDKESEKEDIEQLLRISRRNRD